MKGVKTGVTLPVFMIMVRWDGLIWGLCSFFFVAVITQWLWDARVLTVGKKTAALPHECGFKVKGSTQHFATATISLHEVLGRKWEICWKKLK